MFCVLSICGCFISYQSINPKLWYISRQMTQLGASKDWKMIPGEEYMKPVCQMFKKVLLAAWVYLMAEPSSAPSLLSHFSKFFVLRLCKGPWLDYANSPSSSYPTNWTEVYHIKHYKIHVPSSQVVIQCQMLQYLDGIIWIGILVVTYFWCRVYLQGK